jgi:glycosyltransferase involved in cell wall biosynthesis
MPALLIITKYYSPVQNGLSHHTALLAELLSSYSAIHIVCEGRPERTGGDSDTRQPVQVHEYKGQSELFRTVAKVCTIHRPDVVLFQYVPHMWGKAGFAPAAAVLPLWIRYKLGIPVITYLHELFIDLGLAPKTLLLALCQRIQLLWIGMASQSLIVTNQLRERKLQRIWKDKIARIPAGNVSGRGDGMLRGSLAPFGFPYIVWFGTLSFDQRLDTLIEAYCELASKHRELRLVLVGGFDVQASPIQELLAKAALHQVKDRVIVKGFVQDEELSDILAGSRVNIFLAGSGPSGRRGVVAAYLKSGNPIVAITGHETDPEFLNGENVLLVPDRQAAALRDAIDVLLTDHELHSRLKNGSAALFRSHYSDDSIRSKLCSILFNYEQGTKGENVCDACKL